MGHGESAQSTLTLGRRGECWRWSEAAVALPEQGPGIQQLADQVHCNRLARWILHNESFLLAASMLRKAGG